MSALWTTTSTRSSFFRAASIDFGSEPSTRGEPSRSQMVTFAPEACRRFTIAAPMPCMPPVTIAWRPAKSSLFMGGRSLIAPFRKAGPHLSRLGGKTAFITAAGQGMGRAAALAFAREVAKVWASDMNAKTVGELDGKEGIRARVLDVTNENDIKNIAAEVGDIDVLFNCAGIVHHGSILDASVKDWDQAFAVNVKSMF